MQMSLDAAMERTFSVAEFGQLLNEVLSDTFPHDIWIQGEVRDMNRARSGHVYFTLVDASPEPGQRLTATLPVVLFEGTKRTINTQIKRSGAAMRIDDGVAVRIRGVPDFYVPSGKLSLRMTGLDPSYTIGQLAASRARLLRMLSDEGVLERNQMIEFPVVPLHIGLVTASGSAAEADFLHELAAADIGFHISLAPTPVQGTGSAQRIAAAVRACEGAGVDVIAVVRGGGAQTDLVAFDDEALARTIAMCSVPVLTGIGHEVDTSVADEVAHKSLKTPTACAARLVEAARHAEQRADELWRSITGAAKESLVIRDRDLTAAALDTRNRVTRVLVEADAAAVGAANLVRELARSRLDHAAHRLSRHLGTTGLHARHRLANASRFFDDASRQMSSTARSRLRSAGHALDEADVRARLLDPVRVLAQGWTITTDSEGTVVRSVADVAPGTGLITRVVDGTIASTVESKQEST